MSELERAVARFRAAMARRDAAAVAELTRAYAQASRALADALGELYARMAAAAEAGETVPLHWLLERERLDAIERSLREAVREAVGPAYTRTAADIGAAARLGASSAASLYELLMGAPIPPGRALSVRAIEQLAATLTQGSPLRALFDALPGQAGAQARAILIQSVGRGRNPKDTARRLRDALDGNRARAATIARTESHRAFRSAQLEQYALNTDALAGWIWICACDFRSCAVCISMHGSVHPMTEPFGSHPNCRCSPAPLPRTLPPKVEPGADVFAGWSDRQQLAVLGPGKFEAYHDGRLALADLVGERNDPRWGLVRYERSLGALGLR